MSYFFRDKAKDDSDLEVINRAEVLLKDPQKRWEFSKLCETYINKPFFNTAEIHKFVLATNDDFFIYVFCLGISNAPVKDYVSKLAEIKAWDSLWKLTAYTGANMIAPLEALKRDEKYKEIFFLLCNHQKTNIKVVNQTLKWFELKQASEIGVVRISMWADMIGDLKKGLSK